MSVLGNALTTVARFKTYHGLGSLTTAQDTILEGIINAVSSYIMRYTGRVFKSQIFTSELIDSNGGNALFVKNFPIDSSAAFTLQVRDDVDNTSDWSTVDAEDYFIEYATGALYLLGNLNWGRGRQRYRATYTAGYSYDNSATYLGDTEGADLEWAAWKLAAASWDARKDNPNVVSERLGDYSVTFGKVAFEDTQVKSVLDKYKKIEVFTYKTPNNLYDDNAVL